MSDPVEEGVIDVRSNHSFEATLGLVQDAIGAAGFSVSMKVDHQAAAAKSGLTMPPTIVLFYGNPTLGTPLMLKNARIALDLPQRVLVRVEGEAHDTHEAHEAPVMVSFRRASTLIRAAGLPDKAGATLDAIQQAIAQAVS